MTNDKRARHPTSESDDLNIYFDKGKVLGWTALGAVLTAVGIVTTMSPPNRDSGLQIACFLFACVMALATVAGILRLCSSAPRLIINHTGIRINSRLLGVGVIEWGEIAGLIVYPAPMQTRLAVVLTDPRAILARQPWPQRLVYLLLKGNLMSSDAIVTSDSSLPISMNELLVKIRERYHHELLHYHIAIRERQRK